MQTHHHIATAEDRVMTTACGPVSGNAVRVDLGRPLAGTIITPKSTWVLTPEIACELRRQLNAMGDRIPGPDIEQALDLLVDSAEGEVS